MMLIKLITGYYKTSQHKIFPILTVHMVRSKMAYCHCQKVSDNAASYGINLIFERCKVPR